MSKSSFMDLSIDCGSIRNSTAPDGREWVGESGPEFLLLGQSSRRSARPSADPPVPYKNSRISATEFRYGFPVNPGQKILRLHFYPASYHGFETWIDYFTVKAGHFTLLRDYSASLAARTLGLKFTIGGYSINSMEDLGMFRHRNEDTSHFLKPGKAHRVNHLVVLRMKCKNIPAFTAPAKIYLTSWKTGAGSPVSQMYYNFTWKIPVDSGFRYLIAETQANVLIWIGDVGIPIYKDYIVMKVGDREGCKYDLLIGLKSIDEVVLGLLHELEIFKLSNHENSLAPKNLMLLPGSRNLIMEIFSRAFVSRNSIIRGGKRADQSDSVELSCLCFSLAEIKLATENFNHSLVIGTGGFGKVYKVSIPGVPGIVAIKRLNSYSRQGAVEFWTEIETLSELRHIHLVSLIGYYNEHSEMILVYQETSRVHYKLWRKGSLLPCFRECMADGDVCAIVDPRLQGDISSNSLRKFVKTVDRCLNQLPKRRPTMAQVVSSLEQAIEKHQNYDKGERDSGRVRKSLSGWPRKAVWSRDTTKQTTWKIMSKEDTKRQPLSNSLNVFTNHELMIIKKNYRKGPLIGGGGLGNLYKGLLSEDVKKGLLPIPVSVKAYDARLNSQDQGEWMVEVIFLSQFSHPNLVKLIGYCCEDVHRVLVYE
ncbi:OLC1v1016017C1 [Oldenlandia corymbosa var. corymbosa]|uniref:OLC1v1016017C1 n=1 Tax=Oldenlandia corymbosa var. corymbosa TaxID=529605 RepID=A0AAV1E4R7_OLDCO|nr:OLC1v1016017C1 [Oldenlandia corymbosa var. corymbosa]